MRASSSSAWLLSFHGAGAAGLAVTAALALAGPAAALDPPYLAEMPSVQQLQAQLRGASALESSARQLCAYNQLMNMVHAVSVSQGRVNSGTPDEMRIAGGYVAAMQSLTQTMVQSATPQDRQSWARLVAQCKDDRSVLGDVMAKFKMGAARAAYVHADPSFAAVLQASAPAAAAPVAADPSVARAKAAHVDYTIVGLPLGEPMSLPSCASVRTPAAQGQSGFMGAVGAMVQQSGLQGQPVTAVCHSEEMDMTAIASALTQQSAGSNTTIKYPPSKCPDWMSNCIVYGNVQGGLLESIYAIVTQAGPSDLTLATQLRHKFGNPTTAGVHHYKNGYGNAVDMVEMEWVLPGLHVEYRPTLLEHGTTNLWALRAETDTLYQRKAAATKSSEAAKQAL